MSLPKIDRASDQSAGSRERYAWAIKVFFGLYVLIPIVTGLFSQNHIQCNFCLGDSLRHHLAFFGYFALGGQLLSYTQPRRPQDPVALAQRSNRPSIAFREDLQEQAVWVSLLISFFYFLVTFNWSVFFSLW